MEILPAVVDLLECSPNLMPFHISHSGSAPISAYFRVKPSPSAAHSSFTQNASNEITSSTEDSQNTLVAEESQCSLATTAESQSASLEEDSQASAATVRAIVVDATSGTNLPNEATSAPLRNSFVAAFRGRQIHGRTVGLPPGYGGIVLNAPLGGVKSQIRDSGTVEKVAQTRGKSRTRQSSRQMETDEDNTMDPGRGGVPINASHTEIQTLIPVSRFSSLTVWSPDIPVDEGKDEYIRSLTEWTKLAAEVRSHVDLEGMLD